MGRPPATINVLRDISQLRVLEEQLLKARKLEAVGTLAGGLAHDFNNLLMGIQGDASLMLNAMPESHPNHDKLRNIERHVKSGTDLTRQLLGFAQGGKYEVKPTDLETLVGERPPCSPGRARRSRSTSNPPPNCGRWKWTADRSSRFC